MRLRVKNWADFQHYKDRSPPWIKLHKKLLDDAEFHCLPDASKALAPMLWLLASEYEDGVIDAELSRLAWRLRMSEEKLSESLKPLIDNGFFIVEQGAINPLAERKQSARLEERETETETEERAPAAPPARKAIDLKPGDVSDQVWSDWLQLRRQKKAAVTQTVLTHARKEAQKAGLSFEAFLSVWCARGSQGLEASWLTPSERGSGSPAAAPPTVTSRAAESTAEYLRGQQMTGEQRQASAAAAREARERINRLKGGMTIGSNA